jgi:hypothetical protein
MKNLAIGLAFIVSVSAYGQGAIDFRNATSQLPSPPDRRVLTVEGTGVIGTQLWPNCSSLLTRQIPPPPRQWLRAPPHSVRPRSLAFGPAARERSSASRLANHGVTS